MNTPSRFPQFNLLAVVTAFACFQAATFAADPAPIPMAGPTAADSALLDARLKALIVQQDPAAQAIFDSKPTVKLVTANSAIIPMPFNPAKHDANVAVAKKGDIDLLLAGDSITDWWIGQNGTPTNAYTKYFGNIKTADFAIAGDKTQGVLYRLQNGEGQGFQPKAIMLMIGTNNIGSNTAREIADGIVADLNELRKDFPNARILLLGIFPRGLPTDSARKTIADINAIISKLDDHSHIFYMDIGAKFLGEDGAFLPNAFRADNLHPQELGYDIWGQAVQGALTSMLNGQAPDTSK